MTGATADSLPPVVVFDLGMVLATPVDLIPRLTAVAAADVPDGPPGTGRDDAPLDVAGFEQGYWAYRAAYDGGSTDAEYWGAVLADAGRRAEPGLIDALAAADCGIWADLAPAPLRLLADLERSGTRLGLLSNAPAAMARWIPTCDWARPFEHLVFSAELRLLKPDPAVYADVTARFAVDPEDILFFDDRPENVAGALEHGWQAHIWMGIADARAVLTACGALSSPER